jgi:hypothetical protein
MAVDFKLSTENVERTRRTEAGANIVLECAIFDARGERNIPRDDSGGYGMCLDKRIYKHNLWFQRWKSEINPYHSPCTEPNLHRV